MIARRLVPLLAAALVASGCSGTLGRVMPACDNDRINSAVLITGQSVAGAEYIPCIEDLKPGWTYEHLQAERGRTRFWLGSDRVGLRFLEVAFEGSCDLSGAVRAPSDEPDIERWVEDVEEDLFVEVVLIPEGDDPGLRDHAADLVSEVGGGRVETRLVRVTLDATDRPTAERIDDALRSGAAAFVIGPRELEEGTVEVHVMRGGGEEVWPGMEPEHAVEEIAEYLGDPVYRAVWYYPFGHGCVTYRFDAKGIGAEDVAYDVMDSLGFLDLGPLRDLGEDLGYVLP
ncbi:MAG: hypothetical protein KQH83_01260 [Actinobacteria bacterium]|nr:hypothetical protein [Actinomycetota bacterium]